MKSIASYILFIVLLTSSCVTPKVYNTLAEKNTDTEKKLIQKEKLLLKLTDEIEVLNNNINLLKKRVGSLSIDSINKNQANNALDKKYRELEEAYDVLSSKKSRYMAEKAKETKKLLEDLEKLENELFLKEDELTKLSISLNKKEKELLKSKNELENRVNRVVELESIINQKDSMLTGLRNRISKALIGLEGDGLTIEQKNGKVYISLEEDLLFASGKYEVNSGGISALQKLAEALALNQDLDVLVEGHTDSIPYKKGALKDNWDLSVMRATSVVKTLINNSNLNANRLTAAGRGEFLPAESNKTKEGRSKNRRIEIIVSPNLDELFNILQE